MKTLIFDTETGGVNSHMNDVQWGAIQVNGLTEEYHATKELSERYDAVQQFYDDMDVKVV